MSLGEHLRNALEKFRNSGTMDKTTVKEAVKEIQRALIGSDVEIKLVLELSKKIEEEAFRDLPEGVNRKEHVIKKTHDFLAELLGGTETQIPQKPGKILLCGLFGSGKTTTSGKLGKYFSKRGQKVGVICADSFRPAAYHQLKQLCEQTDLKFFGIPDEKHAATIVKKGLQELKDCELIIVDSAGRSALDDELVKEIKEIEAVLKAEQKWLVLSADIGQVAKKQAVAFHDAIGMNGVIITKLDGSSKGGGALAACSVTQSPVYFIGTGEKMNDLEEFESTRYLGRIMGYGDLKALLEKVQEAEVNVNQDDAEKILRGEFTLQMFYDQLKAARSMGPLNKVMDLMGLKQKIPQEVMDMGEAKLDNFKVIMDSMTPQEKSHPDLINSSRIERVSKGAGKNQTETRELLKQFKVMRKTFKDFNKLASEKDLEKGGLNLQSLMQKLQGKKLAKKKFKLR